MVTFILLPTMADAKQEMNNGSSGSRMVLAKPRLGGFGSSSFVASSSTTTSCNPFGNVLRPPQLKPASNPFSKASDTEDKTLGNDKKSKNEDTNPEETKEETEAPKFVPLASSGVTTRSTGSVPAAAQPPSTSSSSGFVFGQNLSERVVIKENVSNGEASSSEDHITRNGASDLLFSSAAASAKENNQDEGVETISSSGGAMSEGSGASGSAGPGLAEAAAEYERSHARPPPPAAATTFTGEEGETNILQISCRLYAWEEGSWRERGRGVVRLNDCTEAGTGAGSTGGARLVARATGSLRVLINTKLWGDMVLQRAGNQSIRLTAMDALHQIKLFLVMGAPSDINHLYRELTGRVALSKRTEQSLQHSESQHAAERLEAAETKQDNNQNSRDKDSQAKLDSPDLHTKDLDTPGETDSNESKTLKRKEPATDETSPKRQCPKIVIE